MQRKPTKARHCCMVCSLDKPPKFILSRSNKLFHLWDFFFFNLCQQNISHAEGLSLLPSTTFCLEINCKYYNFQQFRGRSFTIKKQILIRTIFHILGLHFHLGVRDHPRGKWAFLVPTNIFRVLTWLPSNMLGSDMSYFVFKQFPQNTVLLYTAVQHWTSVEINAVSRLVLQW